MDEEICASVECRSLTPGEIAAKLGISEGSATSLICFLAQEGKVRIALVSAPSSDFSIERATAA